MTLEDLINQLRECNKNNCGLGYSEQDLRLLSAIIMMPFLDEENHNKFNQIGFDVAKMMYQLSMMNTEYKDTVNDPENPDNWYNAP